MRETNIQTRGISIVIPAFNEEKYIPETLGHIKAARSKFERDFGLPIELIVVDNASTDDTSKVSRDLGARVVLHETRNIASVRNAGIRASTYDLVVTVDADTFVPVDTFTEIWNSMETGKFVGGGARLGIRSKKLYLRIFVNVMEKIMVMISGLSGGLFFFSRAAALEIGGFPETHLIAEDLTFARSLRDYGLKRGLKFLNLRSVRILTFDRK